MRARYYDPEVGRFINEDPIGLLAGINMYSYVKNNATNLIDPWGLQCEDPMQRYERFRKAVRTTGFVVGAIGGWSLSAWSDFGIGWSIGIAVASGASFSLAADAIFDDVIHQILGGVRDWSEQPSPLYRR